MGKLGFEMETQAPPSKKREIANNVGVRTIFAKSSLVFQGATTRVAPTFQAERAQHVGATLVVALPALQQSHAHPNNGQTLAVHTTI